MRPLLLSILFMGLAQTLVAQQPTPEHFCGSHQPRSKWLKQYQLDPDAYNKGGDTTLYIGMSIHLVGTDEGTGYFSPNGVLAAFCKLNELFAPVGIQFIIVGEFHYIPNSAYYVHESVLDGAAMMFEYNVPGTLNTYFVSDPAGNCGYNLPYGGIANAISCSGAADVTWAHETGHALHLPHPFLGWEGGVSWDGSVTPDFTMPAPERVTFDYTFFKDTLILDTLIIDTTYVELVDRSNCTFAADGFCDTPSDYLAGRWNCNSQGVSPVNQIDPNGVSFQSDGSLIMSYANDACQNRFSPDQQAAMRAYALNERSAWLREDPQLLPMSQSPQLVSPESGGGLPANEALFEWMPVPEATHYVIQVSLLTSFPAIVTQTVVTTEPFLLLDNLQPNRTYFWRVRAYNAQYTCGAYTANRSFLAQPPVGVVDDELARNVVLFPNPAKAGAPLQLQLTLNETASLALGIYSVHGQRVFESNFQVPAGEQTLTLNNMPALPAGLYTLVLRNATGVLTRKLVVY